MSKICPTLVGPDPPLEFIYVNYQQPPNGSKQGQGEGGISDGTTIRFRYNGVEGTLNAFANSKQNWRFTGIDTSQTFYIAFKTYKDVTFTVSDIRVCHARTGDELEED
eukprot:155136_1